MPLPNTVEEMQSVILQGDLTENPYLQPHAISGKDKELKTKAKKIIPAINELLKSLNVVHETMQGFTDEVYGKMDALQEEMTSYDESLNKMRTTYDQTIQAIINEIETIKNNATSNGAGAGGETLKRVFHSSIELPKNGSIKAPFTIYEIQDLHKQIEVLTISTLGNTNVMNTNPFEMRNSSSSLYQMYTYPVNMVVNKETGEITLIDKAGLSGHIINFYTMA